MMKKYILLFLILNIGLALYAKDYNASFFGIKSDGRTLNTRSIQKAVDHIHQEGGGTLVFYVGRYLTGTIHLKSNVTIKLQEGAIILGSPIIYDYKDSIYSTAIFVAHGQQNINIVGLGVIEGNSNLLEKNTAAQVSKNYISHQFNKPYLMSFTNCQSIAVDSINLFDSFGTFQFFKDCKNVSLKNITLKKDGSNKATGIEMEGCTDVSISRLFFNTNADPIITKECNNITMKNSVDVKGNEVKN